MAAVASRATARTSEKTPTGMRVTRYYCPTAHETFSLLPDCLASRFPSDLDELEQVVAEAATARSIEAGADQLRPDIELRSAVRWLRRRLMLVRASSVLVAGLIGVAVTEATLSDFRTAWRTDRVLVTIRGRAGRHIAVPRRLSDSAHVRCDDRIARGVANTRWGLTARARLAEDPA